MIPKNKLTQLTTIIALILVSVALTACGGNSKKEEITPGKESKVKIDGKEYDVKTTEEGAAIKIGE